MSECLGGCLLGGAREQLGLWVHTRWCLLLPDSAAAGVRGEVRCGKTISENARDPVSAELMMGSRLLTMPCYDGH